MKVKFPQAALPFKNPREYINNSNNKKEYAIGKRGQNYHPFDILSKKLR
jgi:hypothetical protein